MSLTLLYLRIYRNIQLMTSMPAVFPFQTLRLEFAVALCSVDSSHLIALSYLKGQESKGRDKK